MAKLSDADMRVLLGENYKDLTQQDDKLRNLSDNERAQQEKLTKYAGYRTSALVVAGIAAIIFVADETGMSGPFNALLAILSGGISLVFAASAYYLHASIKGLRHA